MRRIILVLAICYISALPLPGHEFDFFIAPDGDDASEGTVKKPFATLARAQEAVRKLRGEQPDRTTPVVINLRGGTYRITEPIIFTEKDSGNADSPAIYVSYPGEQPVISGGIVIDDWREEGGFWITALPEVREGDWYFRQLWVNGQRRFRPRFPTEGYLYIERAVPTAGTLPNRFQFKNGDVHAGWHNQEDVELLIFHHWSMSRLPITDIDENRRIVTLSHGTWHNRHAALHAGKRYIIENVYEAIRPGEWYLDRQSGELFYLPLENETHQNTEVVVPRARQLVNFVGGEKFAVGHIELRGIIFEHTLATLPDRGYCVAQAEVGARGTYGRSPLVSAIEATGSVHLTIAGCTIRHVGAYAVEFGISSHNNLIRSCEMWDLGAGGIRIGSNEVYPEGDARNATSMTVEDCLISHGGRMHPAAAGIWVGHAGNNRIMYNTVHDFYYTGISVGWNWSYGYSPARENIISHNHIYDIGQGRLDDLGGIYTLGVSDGTVISNNRIHDVSRVAYTGAGIYLDQSSSGLTIKNNFVFRTQDAGFTVNYARNNIIRNNIFAYGEEFTLNPGRADAGGPMTFEYNLILWDTGSAYRSSDVRKDFAADNNLYWPKHGETDNFAKNRDFAEWQAMGKDQNSIFAAPGFVDQTGDGFLRHDSPARELGFQPWGMQDVGHRTSIPNTKGRQAVLHAFPFTGISENVPINENFALYSPGARPSAVHLFENNEIEVTRITDETAVSGGRSLKFTNGPSQPSWNPHCFWTPNFTEGTVEAAFDILLKPGAVFMHEWRDTGPGSAYRNGPSLQIEEDGSLLTGNRTLMKLPHNRWINLKIICGTGEQADGHWELTVQIHGARLRRFEKLVCSPAFRRLRWFGFVASGTTSAEIYLDNVKIHPSRRFIASGGE